MTDRTAADVAREIQGLSVELLGLFRAEGHGPDSAERIECEEIQRLARNLAWPQSRASADPDVLARYRRALCWIAGAESGVWGPIASEALFPKADRKKEAG